MTKRCLLLSLLLIFPCSTALGSPVEAAFEALKNKDAPRSLALIDAALAKGKSPSPIDKRQLAYLRALAKAYQTLSNDTVRLAELDKTQASLKAILPLVRVEDAPFLARCAAQAPVPVRPYAGRWLSRARTKARKIASITALLKGLAVKDGIVRKNVVAAIARRLAKGRKKVVDGQALSVKERRFFSSRLLINALIDELSKEQPKPELDQLPALQCALSTWNTRAIHALILIEEPALERLEIAEKAGISRASVTIKRIRAAARRRQRRHPGSVWHSATPPRPAPTPGKDSSKTAESSDPKRKKKP